MLRDLQLAPCMKKQILFLITLFLPFLSLATSSTSSQYNLSAEYKPKSLYGKNAIGIELLGRGIAYSLNYDRLINAKVSLGVGFSYYQIHFAELEFNIAFLPAYLNYYFVGYNNHRGFITAGATLVYARAEYATESWRSNITDDNTVYYSYAKSDGAIIYPSVGVGYEFRTRSGFLARVAAYGQYVTQFYPWAGVTLGANF